MFKYRTHLHIQLSLPPTPNTQNQDQLSTKGDGQALLRVTVLLKARLCRTPQPEPAERFCGRERVWRMVQEGWVCEMIRPGTPESSAEDFPMNQANVSGPSKSVCRLMIHSGRALHEKSLETQQKHRQDTGHLTSPFREEESKCHLPVG